MKKVTKSVEIQTEQEETDYDKPQEKQAKKVTKSVETQTKHQQEKCIQQNEIQEQNHRVLNNTDPNINQEVFRGIVLI